MGRSAGGRRSRPEGDRPTGPGAGGAGHGKSRPERSEGAPRSGEECGRADAKPASPGMSEAKRAPLAGWCERREAGTMKKVASWGTPGKPPECSEGCQGCPGAAGQMSYRSPAKPRGDARDGAGGSGSAASANTGTAGRIQWG